MITLTKHQKIILAVNSAVVIFFTAMFTVTQDYGLYVYTALAVILISIFIFSLPRAHYSNGVLWGLTAWLLLHFMGGGVVVGGEKLYSLILFPLNSEIIRYDQLVHAFGFGVATVCLYELLVPFLKKSKPSGFILGFIIVMAGLGVGAVNEIVEFIVTLVNPENNVGGYVNTSLDLIADFIGAVVAYVYIYYLARIPRKSA